MPRTVSEHIQSEKDKKPHHHIVNDALKFPLGDAFEKDLTGLMAQNPEESGEPLIIAVFDFDNFLLINENFGHDAGDKVLIDTGKFIRSKLPEGADIYRFGGDEFGIIFHNDMEKEDVFLLLESIRRELSIPMPDGSNGTISIGVAAAFEDANRVPELIRKAEGALYRAKVGGRNKVALAREEKMVPKTSHYTQDQLKNLTKLSKREGIGEAILLREALDMLLKKYDI